MMLQSAVLAVGAYLVIHQEASAGIIIAGSILSARALAPVDLAMDGSLRSGDVLATADGNVAYSGSPGGNDQNRISRR